MKSFLALFSIAHVETNVDRNVDEIFGLQAESSSLIQLAKSKITASNSKSKLFRPKLSLVAQFGCHMTKTPKFTSAAIFSLTASLLTLIPQPAQAANLPGGLAAFTWILNDVTQTIENAINIIQSFNPQPVAGLVPPVSIIFTESPSQIVLAVQGGDFDVDSTQTFGISGNYWNTSIGISQDAGIFFDTLGLSGNLTHKFGPHPDDGLGSPAQFTASWSPPFSATSSIPNITVHPANSHIDIFNASLTGTTSGIGSDIGTWNFTATGTHSVPGHSVPGPLPLLGIGVAFRYSRKLRNLTKVGRITMPHLPPG